MSRLRLGNLMGDYLRSGEGMDGTKSTNGGENFVNEERSMDGEEKGVDVEKVLNKQSRIGEEKSTLGEETSTKKEKIIEGNKMMD